MLTCLCGAAVDSSAEACGSCALAVATIASIRAAETPASTAATVTYARPARCQNCLRLIAGAALEIIDPAVGDVSAGYCDECQSLLDLHQQALAELADIRRRHIDDQIKQTDTEEVVPLLGLREACAELAGERLAEGYLPRPRPPAAWVAAKHPGIDWLACLDGAALAFHRGGDADRARVHRDVLAEQFPDLRAVEWAAIFG